MCVNPFLFHKYTCLHTLKQKKRKPNKKGAEVTEKSKYRKSGLRVSRVRGYRVESLFGRRAKMNGGYMLLSFFIFFCGKQQIKKREIERIELIYYRSALE